MRCGIVRRCSLFDWIKIMYLCVWIWRGVKFCYCVVDGNLLFNYDWYGMWSIMWLFCCLWIVDYDWKYLACGGGLL